MRVGLAGVAILQMALSESFQGACFLGGGAEVPGDSQGLGVVLAGQRGVRGPGRQLAEAVERLGLAEPVAEISEQGQGLLLAGGGGRVVAGLLLQDAEVVEGVGQAEQVAEAAEQRQGLLLAGGSGRAVPGQVLHQAQVVQGSSLSEAVPGAAGQGQGLLLAGGGGRVVPGQHVKEAQLIEDVGLARQVPGVTVERKCPGQTSSGSRVVAGLPLHDAQFGEGVRLAEPVAGPARRGQGGPVEGSRLIPVTARGQEAAHRDGQGEGMRETCAVGRAVGGGVQVCPVGFQPGACLLERGQVRGLSRRQTGRRTAVGAGPGGEILAGGQGGVQVVIQQPGDRGV